MKLTEQQIDAAIDAYDKTWCAADRGYNNKALAIEAAINAALALPGDGSEQFVPDLAAELRLREHPCKEATGVPAVAPVPPDSNKPMVVCVSPTSRAAMEHRTQDGEDKHTRKPIIDSPDILERIKGAKERLRDGHALMRIPVDATDPDCVLADAEVEIERLRAALASNKDAAVAVPKMLPEDGELPLTPEEFINAGISNPAPTASAEEVSPVQLDDFHALNCGIWSSNHSCTCHCAAPHNQIASTEEGVLAAQAVADLNAVYDLFHIGTKARSIDTLLVNCGNASRRGECLWRIEQLFSYEVPDEDDPHETVENCDLSWGHDPDEYIEAFKAALPAFIARHPEFAAHPAAAQPSRAEVLKKLRAAQICHPNAVQPLIEEALELLDGKP